MKLTFFNSDPYLYPKNNHNPDTNIIRKPNPNADFVRKMYYSDLVFTYTVYNKTCSSYP